MTEWDQLLRWHCRDLRDPLLRQACGHWILCAALGRVPTDGALPKGLALSTAHAPAAAGDRHPGPVVFERPEPSAPVQLFGLWQEPDPPGEPHPLNRDQWLFWVVPSRQLHPERRSMGLNPLRRAHGEGLTSAQLAERLLPLLAQPPG